MSLYTLFAALLFTRIFAVCCETHGCCQLVLSAMAPAVGAKRIKTHFWGETQLKPRILMDMDSKKDLLGRKHWSGTTSQKY